MNVLLVFEVSLALYLGDTEHEADLKSLFSRLVWHYILETLNVRLI